MKAWKRWLYACGSLSIAVALLANPAAADLEQYLRKSEPQFSWGLTARTRASSNRIFELRFTSQVWQGNPWEHQLQVYAPGDTRPGSTTFLWVTGGTPSSARISLGMELARKIGAPVAFLYNIPNQPLLEGDLREDDLIAETFVRYLKTGDENWPLLFPMVKSVVKAMDVLQAFTRREWKSAAKDFVVSGASKRGWTAWLTAAVDARVRAIAPVVIDTLNMRAQMKRQVEALGGYSDRLAPYASRGLLPIPETPRAERLLNMVDPWGYRDRLSVPKLLVNGTNDFYWATGAVNLYWNDLPGNKWLAYVPNAGHDLRRRDRPKAGQSSDLIDALAAFTRHQIRGVPMPRLAWRHEADDGVGRLTIEAEPSPLRAGLWVAQAPTQDFRAAEWSRQPVEVRQGRVVGEVRVGEKGYAAYYGELEYEIDGIRYRLATPVQIAK